MALAGIATVAGPVTAGEGLVALPSAASLVAPAWRAAEKARALAMAPAGIVASAGPVTVGEDSAASVGESAPSLYV